VEAFFAAELEKQAAAPTEPLSRRLREKREKEQLEEVLKAGKPYAGARAAARGAAGLPAAIAFSLPMMNWMVQNWPSKLTSEPQIKLMAHRLQPALRKIYPDLPSKGLLRTAEELAHRYYTGPSPSIRKTMSRLRTLFPGELTSEAGKAFLGRVPKTVAEKTRVMQLLSTGVHPESATMAKALAAGGKYKGPGIGKLYAKALGKASLRSAGIAAPFAGLGAALGYWRHRKKKKELRDILGKEKKATASLARDNLEDRPGPQVKVSAGPNPAKERTSLPVRSAIRSGIGGALLSAGAGAALGGSALRSALSGAAIGGLLGYGHGSGRLRGREDVLRELRRRKAMQSAYRAGRKSMRKTSASRKVLGSLMMAGSAVPVAGLIGHGVYKKSKKREAARQKRLKTQFTEHEGRMYHEFSPGVSFSMPSGSRAEAYKRKILEKTAKRDMPSFTKQRRPKKVKEIYRALKRDHPSMPAEMKARIAARQGKKGKQEQGPPYKGELSEGYSRAARLRDEAAKGKTAAKKKKAPKKPNWTLPNEPLDSEKPIIIEKKAGARIAHHMWTELEKIAKLTLAQRLLRAKARAKAPRVQIRDPRTGEMILREPRKIQTYGFGTKPIIRPKGAWMQGGHVS
jgi:hypothetical protein